MKYYLVILAASASLVGLSRCSPDAAARSLFLRSRANRLRRPADLRAEQQQQQTEFLTRNRRQSAYDGFDSSFFNSDGFGDFAREDLDNYGENFDRFSRDKFASARPPAAQAAGADQVSRRQDDSRDVFYTDDPADLWRGDVPEVDYGRRQEQQQQQQRYEQPQYRQQQQQQQQQQHRARERPQSRRREQDPPQRRPQYQYREPEPRQPEPPQQQHYDVPRETPSYEPQRRTAEQPQPERRRRIKVNNQRPPVQVQMPEEPVERISEELYKPASGPAYATATNVGELNHPIHLAEPRFDNIPYPTHGEDVPADQRSLEEAVINGANSYRPDGGVYQKEDRLEFQIHGHQGPHSYRYGYDTGNGYNRQFRYEERDKDGYVKGRYGFFDKHGKLQIVNYSADPYKGFHAEGAHVPQYPH